MRNRIAMLSVVVVSLAACAGNPVDIGGSGGGATSSTGGGSATHSTGGGSGNGGGTQMSCLDADHDGVTTCAGDCNDSDANVHPGATETQNGVDDDCDGKVDNHITGQDFDHDGSNYGETDCNDDESLVGPLAVEDPTNGIDDNCNGQIDEMPTLCEGNLTGAQAGDYAKAIGLCNFVTGSSFTAGNASARNIRAGFGDMFTPKQGAQMVFLSTGNAKDDKEMPTYNPQPGFEFHQAQTHPLWAPPKCGNPSEPQAQDVTELTFTIQVPQNAKSFSYEFAFFSAEYPEYICTDYNDRFIAILESGALNTSMLPMGQCKSGTSKPTCNVSYDSQGQPVTINNGFFDVCDSYSGPNADGTMVSNTCTKGSAMLAKTGYDRADPDYGNKVGGGTGWLKTTAPVTPGETITLHFIILDEGDDKYDSSVLIDNFQWGLQAVSAPVTETPPIN